MTHIRILHSPAPLQPVPTDFSYLREHASHEQFFDAAISLAVELSKAGESMVLATSARGGRNEGILRGLVVRTVKLLDRLVSEICEHHGEMVDLLGRSILEATINAGWLINGDQHRFEQYVHEGVVTALRRRATITEAVSQRGGSPLPVEKRQLNAIDHELRLAGVDPPHPSKKASRMPPFEQRLADVFSSSGEFAYDFVYRIESAAVHGLWKDLLDRHVTSDGRYLPLLEWRETDPIALLHDILIVSLVWRRLEAYYAVAQEAAVRLEQIAHAAHAIYEIYAADDERSRGN
jgi:hypothetical protein